MERLEVGHAADVVLERERDDLAGVGTRSAADGHDQVGTGSARGLDRLEHIGARRVRADARIGKAMAIAERAFDRGNLVSVVAQGRGGEQEHAAGADAFGFGGNRLGRGLPENNPLGRGQCHFARLHHTLSEHGSIGRQSECCHIINLLASNYLCRW